MKKTLSFVLILAMVLSLSTPAFSDETNTGTAGTSILVSGTYAPAGSVGKISVTVAWDEMNFTYTTQWNPSTHQYDGTGSWSDETKTITVTNHSNVAVKATLAFNATVSGVTGAFTESSGAANDDTLELATAVGTVVENAPTASAEFCVSGGAITENKQLGTITVTIQSAA